MALSTLRVPALAGIRFFVGGQALPSGATLQVQDDAASPSTLSIALSDELLSVGAQHGGFAVLGSFDAAAGRLTLRAGSPSAPLTQMDSAGGLLELRWIELQILLVDSDGDGVPDAPAPIDPVQAVGRVRWGGAAELGFGAGLELGLGHAGDRFTLQLVQPLDWPDEDPVLRLAAGSRFGARVLAGLHPMALEVGLDGEFSIAPGGTAQALLHRVDGVVQQLIGGAAVLPAPQRFALRQRFTLPGSGELAARAPNWDATRLRAGLALGLGGRVPHSGSLLQGLPLAVELGDASLELPLLSLGAPGTTDGNGWALRLADVAIGFPQVQGLELPLLRGDLRVESFDAQALLLVFEPAAIQPLDLPAALHFLLARLRWLAQALPLDELAGQVGLSLDDAQWLAFFTDALGPAPSLPLLQGLIEPALAVLDAERVFALLLRAIAQLDVAHDPDGWAEAAWNLWFSAGAPALPAGVEPRVALVRLVQRLFDLAPNAFARVLAGLFRQAAALPVDPGRLVTDLLQRAPTLPVARLQDFVALCARVVALAAQHLPSPALAGQVAAALLDLLRPSQRTPGLQALAPALPLPTGLLGEVHLPLADWLVGQVLAALALGPMRLAPPAGWDRLPGIGDSTVTALAGLLQGVEVTGARVITMFHGLFASMHLPSLTDPDERALALEREWALLNLVRQYPAAALLLIPASIAASFWQFPGLFAQWVGKDVTKDSSLSTQRLHEPGPATRYLIVSDIHRDAASDDRGPVAFGSIHHFKDNSALYRQVLAWVREHGYTLIENGDCEELWYIREAFEYDTPQAKMQAIMNSHALVYADLWELFLDGRYHRIIGNHDSYLREMMAPQTQTGVTRPWLQWRWKEVAEAARPELAAPLTAGSPTLRLLDFAVIDGVKTMGEHGLVKLLGDVWSLPEDPQAVVRALLAGRLGMDAAAYTERKPMLVCHGHQFDVWNHDQTAVIGKLISNGVGVPVDQVMDPFIDLKGIALGGSAAVDFRKLLARAPVANSWLADNVALRMAHEIQHQADETRLPIDDIMFSESLAILLGNLLLPLEQPVWETVDGRQVVQRAAVTVGARAADEYAIGEIAVQPGTPLSLHNVRNHLCIGHTHTPQSQPYYLIPDPLAEPLRPLVEAGQAAVNAVLPLGLDYTTDAGVRLPMRSHYYNTGTASWFRGVIWAIQISESGQARAVYFTENSRGPETMDWELKELDPAVRERIEQLTASVPSGNVLDWVAARLAEARDHLGERFADALAQLGVPGTVALPLQALMLVQAAGPDVPDLVLERIDALDAGASATEIERAGQQLAQLQAFFLRLVAVLAQRAAGVGSSVQGQSLRVRLPVDAASRERYLLLRELYEQLAGDQAGQLAAACFLALYRLPMLGADVTALPSDLRLLQGRAPVFAALLTLTATLPFGAAAAALPGGVTLRAGLTVEGDSVVLSVQLQEVA